MGFEALVGVQVDVPLHSEFFFLETKNRIQEREYNEGKTSVRAHLLNYRLLFFISFFCSLSL